MMNEFENRWSQVAAAARRGMPVESSEAPLGFATRVVAHWQSRPALSLVSLWQGQAWRALKLAMALLLAAFLFGAVVDLEQPATPPLAAPPVEDTVTDSICML